MNFRIASIAGIILIMFSSTVYSEGVNVAVNTNKDSSPPEYTPSVVDDSKETEEEPAEAKLADVKKKRLKGVQQLLPDVANDVKISRTELNRISSDEAITSIKYDKKVTNLIISYKGTNAYILYPDKTEVLAYIETKNNVYPLRLIPTDIKAVHYVLSDGGETYSGKGGEFLTDNKYPSKNVHSTNKEKRLVEMLKVAYSNQPTDENSKAQPTLQKITVMNDMEIFKYKTYTFLDDGINVNVYLTRLAAKCQKDEVAVSEKDFLIPEIGYSSIGISIEHNFLNKERYTRVFVISGRG